MIQIFSKNIPILDDCESLESLLIFYRNPTPESSNLPKWQTANEVPVNYYRIGRLHFESKPLFGMESGGLFDERTKFWRELGANKPTNHTDVHL